MKKEDVISLFVYAVLIGLVLTFGLTVLKTRPMDETTITNNGAYIGYLIGAVFVGIIFNALLFELSHLLGAKLGRYEVLSFNVLYFCFTKVDGKYKFGFKSFQGLTGETKILPKKDVKKTPNPTPYLTLGSLLYIIEGLICLGIFIAFTSKKGGEVIDLQADIAYFLLIVAFVGLLLFLYNIVPAKLDSVTDGYRLTLVSNPKNKVAFNELLRVQHEIAIGNKDVEIMTFDVITNFTADLNLNKVYLLLNDGKYEEAIPLIDQIINSKKDISNSVYIDALSQLVFIKMMTLPYDDAVKFVNDTINSDLRREIANNSSMVSSRAYILIEGLIDKSKSECIQTIANIQKSFKRTSKARQGIEIKLFNLALDKVIEKHPNWEFEQYRLVETKDNKSIEIKGEDETTSEPEVKTTNEETTTTDSETKE